MQRAQTALAMNEKRKSTVTSAIGAPADPSADVAMPAGAFGSEPPSPAITSAPATPLSGYPTGKASRPACSTPGTAGPTT